MARAYVSHSGGHKKESLSSVKCGFKECTQVGLVVIRGHTVMRNVIHRKESLYGTKLTL